MERSEHIAESDLSFADGRCCFGRFYFGRYMKEIPLNQGKVALVDDEDFEELNQFKWYVLKDKNRFYVLRHTRCDEKRITEYMHRRILNVQTGQEIDHINHDGLDNRRSNLRICTSSQNQGNRMKQKKKTLSRFKGVGWHKQHKAWSARIQCEGWHEDLGYFDDEKEAARAYDAMAKKLFGKFAFVNFPKPVSE